MDAVTRKKILLGAMAIFIFGACSLLDGGSSNNGGVGIVEPTAILSPTPNLTLTAVFAQATANAPEPGEPTSTDLPDPASPTDEPGVEVTQPAPPTPTSVAYAETPAVAVVDQVEAHYLNSAPTIDGALSEWPGEMYSMSDLVYGPEYYANSADLSGQFKIAWDNDNLYLGVVVFDTRYSQTATGTQMFMGDSLEILMDTNLSGDASDTQLSGDDYQIGISAGNLHDVAIPEAFMWYPSDKIGTLPGVEIAGVLINGGYVVEIAMPWSVVGVTPTNGKIVGFLFSISDNDMQFMNKQQSVVSFSPSRELQNPTSWSELKLIKP
ncbi:MAG: sugar-binding protein [Chloroflexota bacterium]